MIRILWTALVIGAVLAPPARAADLKPAACEDLASGKRLTFKAIDLKIQILRARQTVRGITLMKKSEAEIKRFWEQVWPHVKTLAAEGETSVTDLVAENLMLFELIKNESPYTSVRRREASRRLFAEQLRGLRHAEQIPVGQKPKAKDWDFIYDGMMSFYNLAMLAWILEREHLAYPTLDPLGDLTLFQVIRILDSLDDSSLERAVKAVERARHHYLRRKALLALRTAPPPLVRPQPLPQARSDEAADELLPGVPEPENAPTDTPLDPADERNLARVLRDRLPLQADFPYLGTTVRNQELDVFLSSRLIEDHVHDEARIRDRLLKTIFRGRGDSSGIKTLFDIGDHIVEIKSSARGAHYRILGCLKGRELRLLYMIDIKSDRNTYFRRIPSNLCQ